MTYGYPHICDGHSSDITRFYPHERTVHHIEARCAEHFNKTYGIVHPREQWASERGMRRSPFYAREEALGAVFFDARGWERPQWYESNAALCDEFPGQCEPRPHEWDARWWSPITNAEHLAMRSRVGMVDLTAFCEFDITGPGALDALQYLTVNSVNVAVGRSVYTPLLTPDGGFRSDLTILRLGDEHFRVVTGAFDGGRDEYWFRKYLPTDGSVTFTDDVGRTVHDRRVGPPRPRHGAAGVRSRPLERSLPLRVGARDPDRRHPRHHVPHLLRRRPRLGDLHARWNTGCGSGTRSGTRARTTASCRSASGSTRSPVGSKRATASWARSSRVSTTRSRPGSRGRRSRVPTSSARPRTSRHAPNHSPTELCTLSMTSHRSESGIDRFPTGGNEPILTLAGERIVDAKGRVSRVTTAGAAPSLGQYPPARIPPARACRRRHRAARDVHERAVPRASRARREPTAVRSRRRPHEGLTGRVPAASGDVLAWMGHGVIGPNPAPQPPPPSSVRGLPRSSPGDVARPPGPRSTCGPSPPAGDPLAELAHPRTRRSDQAARTPHTGLRQRLLPRASASATSCSWSPPSSTWSRRSTSSPTPYPAPVSSTTPPCWPSSSLASKPNSTSSPPGNAETQ